MAKNLLPHNVEAERALLGALLIDPQVTSEIISLVKPDDFYIVKHGWIYKAILTLQARGDTVDLITVFEKLKRQGRLDEARARAYVSGLLAAVPTARHARAYANIVRWTAIRRRMINFASEVVKMAYDESQPFSGALSVIATQFDELVNEADVEIWEWQTLAQACEPKPQRRYVVRGALSIPSLTVVHGFSGSLKTMLMQDLCLCVAGGLPWLRPSPSNPVVESCLCEQSPVLWIDVDNGLDRLERRFAALRRGLDVPNDAPLHYVSFPSASFVASDPASIERLLSYAKKTGARLIGFDNLGTISGGADENSIQMIDVMSGLRRIAEEANAAVVVIQHQNKRDRKRPGNSLRGHSSVQVMVDLALWIERDEGGDVITLRSTKSCDVLLDPLCALWTYERDGSELVSGRFFGLGRSKWIETNASKAQQLTLQISQAQNSGSPQRSANRAPGLSKVATRT